MVKNNGDYSWSFLTISNFIGSPMANSGEGQATKIDNLF